MNHKKIFGSLGTKVLVIVLTLCSAAAIVAGSYLAVLCLNSGAGMSDLMNRYSYNETSAYGRKIADSGLQALRNDAVVDKLTVDGKFDGTQTLDIMHQDAGISYEKKDPATTYTLNDLKKLYESDERTALDRLSYEDGSSWSEYIDLTEVYENGDTYLKDEKGNVYETFALGESLNNLADADLEITPVYKIIFDQKQKSVKLHALSNAELGDTSLEEITETELRAILLLGDEVSALISDGNADYTDYNGEFLYYYFAGAECESVLPQSKETLARYALKNPGTVSISDLYHKLTSAVYEVGQTAELLAKKENGQQLGYYYYVDSKGKVITNYPAWSKLTYEEARDQLIGQKAENTGAYAAWDSQTWSGIESEGTGNTGKELLDQIKYFGEETLGEYQLILAENKAAAEKLDYVIQQEKETYNQYIAMAPAALVLIIAGIAGVIVFFIISIVQAGRKGPGKERYASAFARCIPIEILITIDIVCWVIWASVVAAVSSGLYPGTYTAASAGMLVYFMAVVLSFTGLMQWELLTIICKGKAKSLLKNSLIQIAATKLKQVISNAYGTRKITGKLVMCFCFFAAANIICLLLSFIGIGIPLFILLWGAVLIFLMKQCVQRQKVKEGIHEIAGGNLNFQIPVEDLTGDNLEMAKDMNNVREGMQNAIQEQMKSERLRTDLITNVSHDIKTPLTSIINYVDILKREDIQDEKIRSYIEILDRKSQRLKHLTEDLVEASKISSGNINLNIDEINLKQLLKQTNGEFEEKFARKNLSLVCTLPESQMLIRADGRRMWRVIENLYNNAAKYAMPNTRVYVDGEFKNGKVIVTIKNMSEYPLNFSAEELMERFVRGDVSRNTEGSGLGLEIARNLTVMQKGSFDIYLDGDLFKVTIAFDAV